MNEQRKKPKTARFGFVMSDETRQKLSEIAEHLETSQSVVCIAAIDRLYEMVFPQRVQHNTSFSPS